MDFETIKVDIENKIATVSLNRPEKANAMNAKLWQEFRQVFDKLSELPQVRVVVLRGEGRHFCAGIDFGFISQMVGSLSGVPEGAKQEKLRKTILDLQDCLDSAARCSKPVIAAIHGRCLGGGLDMVAACDMRLATSGAVFSIKEIDLGIVADVGSLQRLPHLVSEGVLREWALTGREISAEKACREGLINRVVAEEELLEEAMGLAGLIASKSPLAVRGTKEVLNRTRDMSVQDGLDYVATWNASMLLSKDAQLAGMAAMAKRQAVFDD